MNEFICISCHYETPFDDVVVKHGAACICLRCITQSLANGKPMPKTLRAWLINGLAEVG